MNCVTNAECNSVEGEYVCQCRDGYSGDGTVQCDLITSCEYSNNGNAITMEVGLQIWLNNSTVIFRPTFFHL